MNGSRRKEKEKKERKNELQYVIDNVGDQIGHGSDGYLLFNCVGGILESDVSGMKQEEGGDRFSHEPLCT